MLGMACRLLLCSAKQVVLNLCDLHPVLLTGTNMPDFQTYLRITYSLLTDQNALNILKLIKGKALITSQHNNGENYIWKGKKKCLNSYLVPEHFF